MLVSQQLGRIEISWVTEIKEVPVTQLRKKMLEELQRRNYSHRTAKAYIRIVREFAEHFHQSPDKLGPEKIRQYQVICFRPRSWLLGFPGSDLSTTGS